MAQKVLKNAKLACSRLGLYRMPFAWAARSEASVTPSPVWNYTFSAVTLRFIHYYSDLDVMTKSASIQCKIEAFLHHFLPSISHDVLLRCYIMYMTKTLHSSFGVKWPVNAVFPFFSADLCLKMLQELWTKTLASQLFTDRTAASCQTTTCSNCSLTSGSTFLFGRFSSLLLSVLPCTPKKTLAQIQENKQANKL